MKIKLLSDLHHEFQTRKEEKAQPYFQYNGEDVLVLAGDIASGSTNVMETIKRFLDAGFPEVVYVPGNHEYYGTNIKDFNIKMAAKTMQLDNVHFLNPSSVVIGDTMFIGGSLWTNFRDDAWAASVAKGNISDFRLIHDFKPADAIEMFQNHSGYIKHIYEQSKGMKKVIVTHFLPAVECISPQYRDKDRTTSMLNKYFANNLGSWIAELEDTTWLFGHTHDSVDVTIGNTRCVANPFGYWPYDTNRDFKDNFVV